MIHDAIVNELAVRYSIHNDEAALTALLNLLRPLIVSTARRYAFTTPTVSADDYESLLYEGVWRACRNGALANFEGSSNVMSRIHFFWRRARSRAIRDSQRQCRGTADYLEERRPDKGEGRPWEEFLLKDYTNLPGDRLMLEESMREFRAKKPDEHKLIMALLNGDDTQSIARRMGRPSFDACARQRVSRARAAFRQHIEAAGIG